MKKAALSELEETEKTIAEKEKEVVARLSAVFEENCDRWVNEAVENIING